MQHVTPKFSCYLIGDNNLLVQCADILLSKKHTILGIISSNDEILDWARKHKIFCSLNINDIENLIKSTSFDYLFSIVNHTVLPNWLIKAPSELAINYHDSLLPKHAGVHATSWAIFNKEINHGITWHIIEDKIDAGDICLKQRSFPIDKKETAFTLNLRCFEEAINAFRELVDELKFKNYKYTKQDLSKRTYNSSHKKLPSNGLIEWHNHAFEIEKLWRALQFGSYTNRLGTAKFLIDDHIFIIGKLKILKKSSGLPPGQIISVKKNGLQITTATEDILITELHTLEGHFVNNLKTQQIKAGDKLLSPSQDLLSSYNLLSVQLSRFEDTLVKELNRLNPFTIPLYPTDLPRVVCREPCNLWTLEFPDQFYKRLKASVSFSNEPTNISFAILLTYLFRLTNAESIGVGLSNLKFLKENKSLHQLVSSLIPLSFSFTKDINFNEVNTNIENKLSRAYETFSKTFLSDIYIRYPVLSGATQIQISIALVEHLEEYRFSIETPVCFVIAKSTNSIRLLVNPSLLDSDKEYVLKNIREHLLTLFEAIASDTSNKPIKKYSFLTQSEIQKILYDWNNTEKDYPTNQTIHQLFEKQAEKTPNKVAVISGKKHLTYFELNEKANQLAHCLVKKGTKPGTLVGILVDRSLEMFISVLGILKTGAAYTPIDPDYPKDRLDYLIQDTKIQVIVTQELYAQRLELHPIEKLILDSNLIVLNQGEKNNLTINVKANDLIYVIYTSGSTGKPKGVMIEHRGIINTIYAKLDLIGLNEEDNILIFANYSFDAWAWEVFSGLLSGACLHVLRKEELLDTTYFYKYIEENNITEITLPPSILTNFEITFDKTALKTIIVAGERCNINTVKIHAGKHKFINAYGPTEMYFGRI